MSFSGYKTCSAAFKTIIGVSYLIYLILFVALAPTFNTNIRIIGVIIFLVGLLWIWIACLTSMLDLNRDKS